MIGKFSEDLFKAFFLQGKRQDSKSLTDSKIKNVPPDIPVFAGFQEKLVIINRFHMIDKREGLPDLSTRLGVKFNMDGLNLTLTLLSQAFSLFICNNLPVVDDKDPVTDCFNLLEDMCGEKHRLLFTDMGNQVPYFDELVRVKSRCGFIQNKDPGIMYKCLGQSNSLPVSF